MEKKESKTVVLNYVCDSCHREMKQRITRQRWYDVLHEVLPVRCPSCKAARNAKRREQESIDKAAGFLSMREQFRLWDGCDVNVYDFIEACEDGWFTQDNVNRSIWHELARRCGEFRFKIHKESKKTLTIWVDIADPETLDAFGHFVLSQLGFAPYYGMGDYDPRFFFRQKPSVLQSNKLAQATEAAMRKVNEKAPLWETLDRIGQESDNKTLVIKTKATLLKHCPHAQQVIESAPFIKVSRKKTDKFDGYTLFMINREATIPQLIQLKSLLDCSFARSPQNPEKITFFKKLAA